MSVVKQFVYLALAFTHMLSTSASGCKDSNNDCNYWSTIGECEQNPGYMHSNCKLSCNTCSADDINTTVKEAFGVDKQDVSKVWWMTLLDKQTFLDDIMSYLKDDVWASHSHPRYAKTRSMCTNQNDMCTHWAMEGKCNELDIMLSCGPACKSCEVLDENVRCGGTIDELPNAASAGSINSMFKRIVSDFDGIVHSQPTPEADEPWIVTIDNFITDEEIDRILQYGTSNGYQQSLEIFHGNHGDSKKTQARTSANSWCGYQFGDTCFDDLIVKGLLDRVSNVTTVPVPNFNEMQILRYHPGQYYRTHGDYIEADATKRSGGRILTFFFYFSDVLEGGETEFPRLDPPIKVKPKKGRALLWANVKDGNPHIEDTRMWHQALPVIDGVKHAANLWINMRDTRTPIDMKCYD